MRFNALQLQRRFAGQISRYFFIQKKIMKAIEYACVYERKLGIVSYFFGTPPLKRKVASRRCRNFAVQLRNFVRKNDNFPTKKVEYSL